MSRFTSFKNTLSVLEHKDVSTNADEWSFDS